MYLPNTNLICGTGQLAYKICEKSLTHHHDRVVMYGTDIPKIIYSRHSAIVSLQDNLYEKLTDCLKNEEIKCIFIACTKEEANNTNFLANQIIRPVAQHSNETRIINTRSVESPNNQLTVYEPVVNLAEAIKLGCKGYEDKTLAINLSSTAGITPGFDKVNCYARFRKLSDQRFLQIKDSGITSLVLALDFLEPDRTIENLRAKGNHGVSFAELALEPLLFVLDLKNRKTFAFQPIEEKAVVNLLTKKDLFNKVQKLDRSDLVIPTVGPQTFTQEEALDQYIRLYSGRAPTKKSIKWKIDTNLGKFIASTIGWGQLRYGIPLMCHRDNHEDANRAYDHKPFEKLSGKPLKTLSQIHNEFKGPIIQKSSGITYRLGTETISKLGTCSRFRRGLLENLPKLSTLLKSFKH